MNAELITLRIELWPLAMLKPCAGNPRKNDGAVERMIASIRQFGFRIPVLARNNGEVIDGHLRLKAAKRLDYGEIPVIPCDDWSAAQVRACRLMVNRSFRWADWDEELLARELRELKDQSKKASRTSASILNFDLSLTGFDIHEIDDLVLETVAAEDIDAVPPVPEVAISRAGDLWLCGRPDHQHRVLCGHATAAIAVARLLEGLRPGLMITDPPYGIELDAEWRDRAGLNGCGAAESSYMKSRTAGHTNASISSDTRADWSEAFELAPSRQAAYVWHTSVFTREVLDGLQRIAFLYSQQIIWNKGRAVLTRTHYWYAHEPCWYTRKKNAPWYGKAGENSTVWESPSPKFIMGGSGEDKYDHPTQKPVALMRQPLLNHTRRGEWVYDPFLGSGTTLAAAEQSGRRCCGMELDPKYVDVTVQRWESWSGQPARLAGDGCSFAEVAAERRVEIAA